MSTAKDVLIEPAGKEDFDGVTLALTELFRELSGGATRKLSHAREVYDALTSGPRVRGILVARDAQEPSALYGVLTYSFGTALRAGGRYCNIEEISVSNDARSMGIGKRLVDALKAQKHCQRIEVGLPTARFSTLSSIKQFYAAQGFTKIGDRAFVLVDL